MISDPASSRFISWTELGTSFVVSNVGEFSRSILGSHFKHNNVGGYKHTSGAKLIIYHAFVVLELRKAVEHVRVPQNQSDSSLSAYVH